MRRANHCNMVLSQHQIFHTGNRCRMRISAHCQQIATCGLIWPFPVSGIKIKTSQFWMLPNFWPLPRLKQGGLLTGKARAGSGACGAFRVLRIWRGNWAATGVEVILGLLSVGPHSCRQPIFLIGTRKHG